MKEWLSDALIFAIVYAVALGWMLSCTVPAEARSRDALVLAHVCHIEAAFSDVDCACIWWIGVKRGVVRKQSPIAALRAYSVPYKRETERSRAIKVWPWGDVPGESKAFNRRWRAQRAHALQLVRGEVPDPCPPATDWNDSGSSPRGSMVPVCDGLTANRLYSTPYIIDKFSALRAKKGKAINYGSNPTR